MNMAPGGQRAGAVFICIFALVSLALARQFGGDLSPADAASLGLSIVSSPLQDDDNQDNLYYYSNDRTFTDEDFGQLYLYHFDDFASDGKNADGLPTLHVDASRPDSFPQKRPDVTGKGSVEPKHSHTSDIGKVFSDALNSKKERGVVEGLESSTPTADIVPLKYIIFLEAGDLIHALTPAQISSIRKSLATVLNIPVENVKIYKPLTNGKTLAIYCEKPGMSSTHSRLKNLIRAKDVEEILAVEGMQHMMPNLTIHTIYSNDAQYLAVVSSSDDTLLEKSYFPYLMAGIAIALLGVISLLVWCCVRGRRNNKGRSFFHGVFSTSSHSPLPPAVPSPLPQQICLYPTGKPQLANTTTMIQPDVAQILAGKISSTPGTSLGGSGYGTPTYSSSQSGTPSLGTPITGAGTPVHTPPLKLRAKGLLERRGSNASLTIDLSNAIPSEGSAKWGSPPKESSALEYLQSASNRMSRKQLSQCLLNVKAIHEEFWEIPMNHPNKIEVAGSGLKNRYRTIIPNEHSRVKLPEIDNDQISGYINANYIRGYSGEPNAYIATQGPMSNTIADFWRIVWQEKSAIIVMITKLREKNRTKCESYFPEKYGVYDDLEVFVTNISEHDGYILRNLTLKYLNEEHHILHYWYTAWPDHKTPNTARQLLGLVKEAEKQRKAINRGPTIIHCSAGIGRTGCFIAASVGITQLMEDHTVDILSIVCAMRIDRGGMVQTNEQYEFIHQTLSLFEKELPEKPPNGD